METALLGIASSLFAEAVSWLNKKLVGTILQGDGAFLIALGTSVIFGVVKVAYSGASIANLHDLFAASAQTFAVSQIWFNTFARWFNLQIKS